MFFSSVLATKNTHATYQRFYTVGFTAVLVMLLWAGVGVATAAAQTTWNAIDYTLYDTITIDATQIDDDLTDFPVYVDLADLSSNFWSTTPTGSTTVGTDIRVTTASSSPTELPRELVAASSTAQTGELHFKADSISSTTDTVFRIYYNGTTAGDYATSSTYGAQNVWTDYEAVYHDGGSFDSTGNNVDPTANGGITVGGATGLIGAATTFDGSDDFLTLTGVGDIGAQFDTGITMSIHIKTVSTNDTIVTSIVDADNQGYQFPRLGAQGTSVDFFVRDDGGNVVSSRDGSNNYRDGNWHVIHGVLSSPSTNDLKSYFDGSEATTYSNQASPSGFGAFVDDPTFGRHEPGGFWYTGDAAEVRFRNDDVSAAWISAEYTNQSTTTDFYSIVPSKITISGIFYESDGVTAFGSGHTITAAVGTTTISFHSSTTAGSGSYSIDISNPISVSSTTPITLFVDGGSSVSAASTLTYGVDDTKSTSTINGIDLFATTVIMNNATGSMMIDLSEANQPDSEDDPDILFTATTSTTTIGSIATTTHLLVATGTTLFAPSALELYGDFTLEGEFRAASGTISVRGAVNQIFTGSFAGENAFADVSFLGNAEKTFTDNASTTNFSVLSGKLGQIGVWDPNDTSIFNSGKAVVVSNNFAYVAGADSDTVAIVDISDPTSPTTTAIWAPNDTNIMDEPRGMDLVGSTLYVSGARSDNLVILDVSSSTNLVLLANYDPNDAAVLEHGRNVTVSGDYAYISGNFSNNVVILDVSSSTNPTLVGNWNPNDTNVMNRPQAVTVNGDYMYVAGNSSDNVAIVDISSKSTPTTTANYDPNDVSILDCARDIAYENGHVFVAGWCSNTVVVLDVSTPASPVFVSTTTTSNPSGIAVEGNIVFVNNEDIAGGYTVIDATNLEAPEVSASYSDPNDPAIIQSPNDIAVANGYIFLPGKSSDNLFIGEVPQIIDLPDALTISGDFTQNGTLRAGTGTVYMSGTDSTISGDLVSLSQLGSLSALGTTTIVDDIALAGSLRVGATAALTASSTLTVSGDVVNDGALMVDAAVNLYGDITNNATFEAGSSTVNFLGATHTISGSNGTTTFNNLTVLATSTATVTIQAGNHIEVANTLLLDGTASTSLFLRSDTSGLEWYLTVGGDKPVSRIDVSDSTYLGSTQIYCASCVDSGGNTDWQFNPEFEGLVYADQGVTTVSSGVPVFAAVGTNPTEVYQSTTNFVGSWAMPEIDLSTIGDVPVVVWTASTTTAANTLIAGLGDTSQITGIPLYADAIVFYGGASTSSLAAADFDFYDSATSSESRFSIGSATSTFATDVFFLRGTTTLPSAQDVVFAGDVTQGAQFRANGSDMFVQSTSSQVMSGDFGGANGFGALNLVASAGITLDGTASATALTIGSVATTSKNALVEIIDSGLVAEGAAYGTAWNGDYLAVGQSGSAYLAFYRREGDTLNRLADATQPGGTVYDVAWSGDYLAVAHQNGNLLSFYKRSGDTLVKLADPTALAGTGRSVAWSGDYLAVGHNSGNDISFYQRSGDTLVKLADPASPSGIMSSQSGMDWAGDYLAVAHSNGLAFYKRDGNALTKLTAPGDLSGATDAAWNSEYLAVTTSATEGGVALYQRSGDTLSRLDISVDLGTSGRYLDWNGERLAVTTNNSFQRMRYLLRDGADLIDLMSPEVSFAATYDVAWSSDYLAVAGFGSGPILLKSVPGLVNVLSSSTVTVAGDATNAESFANAGVLEMTGASGALRINATSSYKKTGWGNLIIDGDYAMYGIASTSDLLVRSGATLAATSGPITIGGDFNNQGSIEFGTSTVYLSGNNSTIQGNLTGSNAIENLFINGRGRHLLLDNASTTQLVIGETATDTVTLIDSYSVGGLYPRELEWDETGTYLAVGYGAQNGSDGQNLVWYKRDGETLTKLPDPPPTAGSVWGLGWSGEYLAVAHQRGNDITFYKRTGDTLTKLASPPAPGGQGGYGLDWYGDYLVLGTFTNNLIHLYKREGDTLTKLPDPVNPGGNAVIGLDFDAEGYLAVPIFTSPYLKLYKINEETDRLEYVSTPADRSGLSGMWSAAWNDSGYLVVGGEGSQLVALYKRVGDELIRLPDPVDPFDSGNGEVYALSWSGNYLLAGIFDSSEGTLLYRLYGDELRKVSVLNFRYGGKAAWYDNYLTVGDGSGSIDHYSLNRAFLESSSTISVADELRLRTSFYNTGEVQMTGSTSVLRSEKELGRDSNIGNFRIYGTNTASGTMEFTDLTIGTEGAFSPLNQEIVTATGNLVVDGVATTTQLESVAGDVLISGSLVLGSATTTLLGDFTNNGTFVASTSEIVFASTTGQQTATGTMTGVSAFHDLTITNTSESGSSSQSVFFGAPVETTDTFTMQASTSAAFSAGATSTFQNVDWQGGDESPVWLRSTSPGTEWYLDIPGSQLNVEYVDVADSNATSTSGGVTPSVATDSGNNTNWNFVGVSTWNATNWTLYDTITIDHTQIDDDLTDFPIYVDLADLSSNFWSTTPSAADLVGTDIRVTTASSSPTELPRELVSASSTAQTGELHFKADSISSTTDTVFRIYYNGTTTGDYATNAAYEAENVWNTDYVAVYHLDETGSTYFDSTVNGYNGVGEGTDPTRTGGQVGGGQDIAAGRIDLGNSIDGQISAAGAYQISAWVNLDTSASDQSIVSQYSASGDILLWADADGTGTGFCHFNGSYMPGTPTDCQDLNNQNPGTWQHVVATHDGTNGNVYLDGLSTGDPTATTFSVDPSVKFSIGTENGDVTARQLDGQVDEVRIMHAQMSDAWLSAEYTNQSTTTDFYTTAPSISEWNVTDWSSYDTITIKHENIDESLTDFPVYVDLNDLSASFWSTTPSAASLAGTDIRVTTDDDTPVELPRELVSASSTAETGELHFKADFINKDADTSFRIYYNGTTTGDYLPDATYGAEAVWTSGYVGVWHLNEGDSTATEFYKDSTGNGYDATMTDADGDTTTSVGQLGSAIDFAGDADFLSTGVPWNTSESEITVSFWNNVTTAEQQTSAAFGAISGGDERISGHAPWSNGNIYWDYGTCCDDGRVFGGYAAYDDKWSLVNMVYRTSPSTLRGIYLDGSLAYSSTIADEPNVNFTNFHIGSRFNGSDYHHGDIDEFRLADTARSAAWIAAEYLNQSTTTDFYSLGAGTSGTGSTTLSDHDATQVDNAFDFQNQTNEPLFAFKLTPESGTATVTELTLELRGAKDINVSDFSNITLYRDHDNDAAYDATDTAVGTGVMELGNRGRSINSNQIGTIVFSEDFLSTTTQNYLITADWNYPERGSSLTIDLRPEDIEAVDTDGAHTFFGTVDHIQHRRNNQGGGGGSSAAVGDPAPAGDGVVSGGGSSGGGAIDTNTDGSTIGNEGDFFWPTAGSGDWQSIANAYDQVDGTYATTSAASSSDLSAFNDSVPGSDTIEGIAVKLEGAHVTAGQIAVELSFDGGSTYTSSGKVTSGLTGTDQVVTLGGPSDTWGRSWSPSEFSDANFRVRITGNALGGGEVRLDAIQVRVYHQASGGSAGGGGAI